MKIDPSRFKWVVENGTAHDRFEVGRCIGGIFSCEQYRGTIFDLNLHTIRTSIDEFLHHSTLVPFNSWDPRFRMSPANVDDSTPSWLDPNLGREGLPEKQSIEGGILGDIKHKATSNKIFHEMLKDNNNNHPKYSFKLQFYES